MDQQIVMTQEQIKTVARLVYVEVASLDDLKVREALKRAEAMAGLSSVEGYQKTLQDLLEKLAIPPAQQVEG